MLVCEPYKIEVFIYILAKKGWIRDFRSWWAVCDVRWMHGEFKQYTWLEISKKREKKSGKMSIRYLVCRWSDRWLANLLKKLDLFGKYF